MRLGNLYSIAPTEFLIFLFQENKQIKHHQTMNLPAVLPSPNFTRSLPLPDQFLFIQEQVSFHGDPKDLCSSQAGHLRSCGAATTKGRLPGYRTGNPVRKKPSSSDWLM
jgi:hypothetical protein